MTRNADPARKINAIRAAARGVSLEALADEPCPTCCRPAAAPYRRIVDGRIVEGCCDAHHSLGSLYGESLAWHARRESREIRRVALRSLAAALG